VLHDSWLCTRGPFMLLYSCTAFSKPWCFHPRTTTASMTAWHLAILPVPLMLLEHLFIVRTCKPIRVYVFVNATRHRTVTSDSEMRLFQAIPYRIYVQLRSISCSSPERDPGAQFRFLHPITLLLFARVLLRNMFCWSQIRPPERKRAASGYD